MVFFATDNDGKIQVLHSPINFGGSRVRLENKVVAMMGLGAKGTTVGFDGAHAVSTIKLWCPDLNLFPGESTAEGIRALPIPDNDALETCDAKNIFLPAPWLRDIILNSTALCPFNLILAAQQAMADFQCDFCKDNEDFKKQIKDISKVLRAGLGESDKEKSRL